jgi:glycosyltransferase involved in cell wall biosynthesis
MVGDGPERSKAMLRCKELGIMDKVTFPGKSNQVYEILCYSDLFVLPSESESFGLAALEAMMMRVPVISTNVGGLPEVNIDGESGYLFELGDVAGMAEKSIALLEDEDRLNQFKEQAYQLAKRYDIDAVVAQYIDIYHKALA